MTLSAQDRIDITDLINLHGHLIDAGALDEAGELYTADVVYDVGDLGFGALHGREAVRAAALELGDANPVGHHVTNIVLTGIDGDSARVRSAGIGIRADGTAGSVGYDDLVRRLPEGWRISRRTVSARHTPLGGTRPGPRAVLEHWRQAAVEQSATAMRRLYAADAVHEFPFAFPEVPNRLSGRESIVDWMTAAWRDNPLHYTGYRSLAVHDTGDPATIIAEQDALGVSAVTGDFALPNIVVLTVHNGEISRLRDYVDVPAAARALGRAL